MKAILGIICLFMAYTTIRAKKFLLFHEEAVGKKWEELESGMQETILALVHLSGLGFLLVGLLLAVVSLFGYFRGDTLIIIIIPILSILFCALLFKFNYGLNKETKANTPWRGTLIASGAIILGFVSSLASL
jgi:hypothetical protein